MRTTLQQALDETLDLEPLTIAELESLYDEVVDNASDLELERHAFPTRWVERVLRASDAARERIRVELLGRFDEELLAAD